MKSSNPKEGYESPSRPIRQDRAGLIGLLPVSAASFSVYVQEPQTRTNSLYRAPGKFLRTPSKWSIVS